MLRVEVTEQGAASALPPLDIADDAFVIGSDPAARVRLPASAAQPQHVHVTTTTWRTADGSGAIGDGITFEIGTYRVRVSPSPVDAVATPPQRTESLARELMRSMFGTDGAPSLVVERGKLAGAKRMLAPPDSSLVIGRGDEAQWVIDDRDLSKRHVEIRRGWDGTRAIDLGSKNGTRVEGVAIREAELRDGMVLEIGNLALRFGDLAERHLRATATPAPPILATPPHRARNPLVFYAAITVALAALAGIAWIIATS